MAKILVVDDELPIADILKFNLEKEGHEVVCAHDGRTAVQVALAEVPDLVLLDLMLPEMDGMDVCREIRTRLHMPIIMLTAKDSEIDKVLGLELGADDYVTKPFSTRELLARVKAQLRRQTITSSSGGGGELAEGSMEEARTALQAANAGQGDGSNRLRQSSVYPSAATASQQEAASSDVLYVHELAIDTGMMIVFKKGYPLELTHREFELISYMSSRLGRVMTRDHLLQAVWGFEYFGDVRTVDVTISRLREKIEDDPSKPEYIVTRRGMGYMMRNPVSMIRPGSSGGGKL